MQKSNHNGCLIGSIIVTLVFVILFLIEDYSSGQRGEFSFFFRNMLPSWHSCGVESFYWDEEIGTHYRFWTSELRSDSVKTFPVEIYVPNADSVITMVMRTIVSYGYSKNEMIIYYLGEDKNIYVVYESNTEEAQKRLPSPYKHYNYLYPTAILIEESEIDSVKYTWVQFVDLQD